MSIKKNNSSYQEEMWSLEVTESPWIFFFIYFFTSLEISLLSRISRGVAALLSCYCFVVVAVVIVLGLGELFLLNVVLFH